MFDLSWAELLVIAVVAIIVVGPKDLPRALRALGHWSGKAKRAARDFQNQFNEAMREAELDTIRKEVESVGKIDPLSDMRKEVREIEASLKGKPTASAANKPAQPSPAAAKTLTADSGVGEPATQSAAPEPSPPEPEDKATDAKP